MDSKGSAYNGVNPPFFRLCGRLPTGLPNPQTALTSAAPPTPSDVCRFTPDQRHGPRQIRCDALNADDQLDVREAKAPAATVANYCDLLPKAPPTTPLLMPEEAVSLPRGRRPRGRTGCPGVDRLARHSWSGSWPTISNGCGAMRKASLCPRPCNSLWCSLIFLRISQ